MYSEVSRYNLLNCGALLDIAILINGLNVHLRADDPSPAMKRLADYLKAQVMVSNK